MPLFLSRVPTIMSLNQLVEEDGVVPGVISTPMHKVQECRSSLLPSYKFPVKQEFQPRVRSFGELSSAMDASVPDIDDNLLDMLDDSVDSFTLSSDADSVVPQKSLLDAVLLAEWEDRNERGLFRYDVTACETKVVRGLFGFIAQLNEGRATKKRPTEFRVDQVVQDFDETKFNFNKALQQEVLFQFDPTTAVQRACFVEAAPVHRSPNLVFINVSPIEYGHVLLVPDVLGNKPQLVDYESMLLALDFTCEVGNPYFRLGYNSLGAYATINHLHFQGYYLHAPYPVERAPTMSIKGVPETVNGVRVGMLANYPVEGFVFECAESRDAMAAIVSDVCEQLQVMNVPHNLLICDCGARVFVWPQCYAAKQAKGQVSDEYLDTGVNPAAFEIAGHLVLKRREDYDGISQEFAWDLLAQVSLDAAQIVELARKVLGPLV